MAVPSARGRAAESFLPSALQPLPLGAALPQPAGAAGMRAAAWAEDWLVRAGARDVAAHSARLAARARIDGLAIGAPVTAAFVGVMLAKGELGIAGAAGGETIAAAAPRPGLAEAGADATASAAPVLSADESGQGGAGGAAAAGALDPVAVAAPGPQAAAAALPGDPVAIPGASVAVAGDGAGGAPGTPIVVNLPNMPALGVGVGLALAEGGGDQVDPLGGYVAGTSGDDTLYGTEERDTLLGGAGDDVIHGLGGDDWLDGGSGDDLLHGDAGDDTLLGGTGNDSLDGGSGDDLLLGGDGDDQLLGGAGRDELGGGAGSDLLDGGGGIDRMRGGTGDDVLIVDHANDLALEQGWGADGGGQDTLQVGAGFGSGPVTFVFGTDLTVSAAGTASARQQVHSEIENLVLTGTAGHDALGDGRDNSLTGNAGDNALYGFAGDDALLGGAGDDLLDGGLGADRLEGGDGHDILQGDAGDDVLYGGAGDDRLAGGQGEDLLYGGAGNDTYVIGLNDSAVDTVFDHEGSNHIRLEGVATQKVQAAIVGDDLYLVVANNPVAIVSGYVGNEASFAGVDLGAGIIAVEDLLADAATPEEPEADEAAAEPPVDLLASFLAQPTLAGSDAVDHLVGTDGADWLSGGAADDALHGGDGADTLEGGFGSDLLQGGAGDDRYLFRSGESGLDTIRDAEGSNSAELVGFTGARLEGVVVGQDLYVVADYAPIFKVENYVGNEPSFAGVKVDETFVPSEELFT
jgi:Ca2+-binding RTX toxin-like protein